MIRTPDPLLRRQIKILYLVGSLGFFFGHVASFYTVFGACCSPSVPSKKTREAYFPQEASTRNVEYCVCLLSPLPQNLDRERQGGPLALRIEQGERASENAFSPNEHVPAAIWQEVGRL